jgi:hypothetical protein
MPERMIAWIIGAILIVVLLFVLLRVASLI